MVVFSMSKIAYASDCIVLDKAVWDTNYGMWVQLKLEQPEPQATQANPITKFTKRRKGKTGTRFGAVFTEMDESIAYSDDVMLKGWTDGTAGWKASFYVNAAEDGFHPFMNYDEGREFAVAMVELDDDEEVIDQDKRDRVEDAKANRRSPRLSRYAAQLCRTPEFHQYLVDRCGEKPSSPEHADDFAAEWMRQRLGVESRSELDRNPEVAAKFHQHIREPYSKWYASHG